MNDHRHRTQHPRLISSRPVNPIKFGNRWTTNPREEGTALLLLFFQFTTRGPHMGIRKFDALLLLLPRSFGVFYCKPHARASVFWKGRGRRRRRISKEDEEKRNERKRGTTGGNILCCISTLGAGARASSHFRIGVATMCAVVRACEQREPFPLPSTKMHRARERRGGGRWEGEKDREKTGERGRIIIRRCTRRLNKKGSACEKV